MHHKPFQPPRRAISKKHGGSSAHSVHTQCIVRYSQCIDSADTHVIP